MILTGAEIHKQVQASNILISPYDPRRVGPNSVNLRLGDELMFYRRGMLLDMRDDNPVQKIRIPEVGYILVPDTIYLARTMERTFTEKFVPMIEGRSSIGRLGLSVHSTAGFGDLGFNGYWTLELSVVQPLKIYPGVEICQIYYHTVKGNTRLKYSGKYQNNTGVQASKLWKDFE